MDFGDILDRWEQKGGQNGRQTVPDKDADLESAALSQAEKRRRQKTKRPDATIDLHGLTSDEAWTALEQFFADSRRQGFDKLLVIHGKGNHSRPDQAGGEGVLRVICRQFIERCPFAGESGYSAAIDGGSGSTWVLLK